MFGRNKNLRKGLKLRNFLLSSWITNFWIIDNQIYFTDAVVDCEKSILYKMPINILKDNLQIKGDLDRQFISKPNNLDLIAATNTDVEIVNEYDNYIFDVMIKNGVLVVKTINKKPENTNFIKIIEIGDNIFKLSIDGKIFLNDKLIYESDEKINICKFGINNILISDFKTKELFYFNTKNYSQKEVIYKGNYFYRLDCFESDLIVCKPLLTNEDKINYHLPLIFIY